MRFKLDLRQVILWSGIVNLGLMATLMAAPVEAVKVFPERKASSGKLPADARELLESFPEKKITLDLVIGLAIKNSDSFKALQAQLPATEAPLLQARAPLDYQFFAKASRINNQNEPQSPFQPDRIITGSASLGVSTFFSTGTSARFELAHGKTDLNFPTFGIPAFFETKGSFQLSQNLWQDAFGRATRLAIEVGNESKASALAGYEESVEAWIFELMEVFYNAWAAQAQVWAAQENTERRQQLLGVTELKLKRGTSERPDELQVRSALINSRTQEARTAQVLGDRWRSLVVALKLPKAWLNLDPRSIPMGLDEPVSAALKLCSSLQLPSAETHAPTRRRAHQAEAARLSFERAKDQLRPDLELQGALVANGIDTQSPGRSFGETSSLSHPAWTVGLSFSTPLGRYAEKAAAANAYSDRERAEALYLQAVDSLELEWLNACSNLRRTNQSFGLLLESLQYQQRREKLDQERFNLGRSSTFSVIQAGDDTTLAEMNLVNTEVERHLAAWRVQRLANGLLEKIKMSQPQ